MKIVYTSHLEYRLKVRDIPHELPRKIFQDAREHYYDVVTGHCVAIGKITFEGRMREISVTYDRKRYVIELHNPSYKAVSKT